MTPEVALYGREVRAVAHPKTLDVPPCIVCDGRSAREAFAVFGVEAPIVVCEGCGLGFYHPLPDAETLAGFYPASYYGGEGWKFRPPIERLVRSLGRVSARQLVRGLAPGASVLDVGCGRGVLLGPIADLGLSPHGLEVHPEAVRGIDPRAQVRIAPGLVEAGYPRESFDAIVLWHVLEHLPNPREVLVECRRLLRPGGRLLVAVPNFSSFQARWSGAAWFHLDPPRHLFHFPAEVLVRLLERCGLSVRSTRHFSLRQNPFGWVQSALNRYSKMPRNALYDALYHGGPALLSRSRLLATLAALAPFGLAASVVAAALRSGATIVVVSSRSEDGARDLW